VLKLSVPSDTWTRSINWHVEDEAPVFSVAIIQIKPQLEKVLNLPAGALTKEIELTQDLMNLFIDYQIPSDLLSCSGDSGATLAVQVNSVKGYVANVKKRIDENLDNDVKKAER
jgi:hypothetical protein